MVLTHRRKYISEALFCGDWACPPVSLNTVKHKTLGVIPEMEGGMATGPGSRGQCAVKEDVLGGRGGRLVRWGATGTACLGSGAELQASRLCGGKVKGRQDPGQEGGSEPGPRSPFRSASLPRFHHPPGGEAWHPAFLSCCRK